MTTYRPVTPGITALEYAQRRTKLAAQLPANAIAVVAASDVVFRTGHVFYNYHQDPDFFYLTGVHNTGLKMNCELKEVMQGSMNRKHWL